MVEIELKQLLDHKAYATTRSDEISIDLTTTIFIRYKKLNYTQIICLIHD